MQDRGHLLTEQRNSRSMTIDRMSIAEGFDVDQRRGCDHSGGGRGGQAGHRRGHRTGGGGVSGRRPADLRRGGDERAAGRGGRLRVSADVPDAAGDGPGHHRRRPRGHVPLRRRGRGQRARRERRPSTSGTSAPNDVVFGIATGGTTPYVHGAIACAKQRGAKTVFFACVPEEQCPDEADVSIRVLTGPGGHHRFDADEGGHGHQAGAQHGHDACRWCRSARSTRT